MRLKKPLKSEYANSPRLAKSSRGFLLIDGSNFYHHLKSHQIANTSKFDYRGLANYILHKCKNPDCRYYVGEVRGRGNRKSAKLRKSQMRLFAHLSSKQQQISISKGYLLNYNGKYKEKGVDVKIALDIALGAYKNLFDYCAIISSDTDLITAMEEAKLVGKKVIYVTVEGRESQAMKRNSNYTVTLKKDTLKKFSSK